MSSEKAELKALVAHDIGAGLDDALEAFQVESHQYRGAKEALRQAVAPLNQYHKEHIDKDIEEGKLTLEEADQIRRYLSRDIGIIENLAVRAEVMQMQTEGKATGMRLAVERVKKYHDHEKAMAMHMRSAEQVDKKAVEAAVDGAVSPASNGASRHPGPTLKSKRIAEEKATKRTRRGKNS